KTCRVFHTLRELFWRSGTPRSASLHVGLNACHRLRRFGLAKSQTNPDRLCLNAERSNVSASFAALPLRPLRFQPIKAASSLPYTFRIGFNAKTAKTFAKIAKTLPRILPLCVL